MRFPRTLAAALLPLALVVSACGEDSSADAASGAGEVSRTEHNDADVAFATDMIQHHAQALSMVDLTLDRPLDPEVAQLAEQIRDAQGPEIDLMVEWLVDWDEEVPDTMRDHSSAGHQHGDDEGMDMGSSMEGMDSDMPGMMSADQMQELADASDADFQQLWLEMMIEHHEGAIVMAEAQQENGQYKKAIDLAEQIASAQADEIATMRGLLG